MTAKARSPLSVKVCGLTSGEDARFADECGADFLGVVLSDGFGRSVPLARAAEVVQGTRARKVAVLVDEPAESAGERARSIGASVLQLHGDESRGTVESLRGLGDWSLWKAVRAAQLSDLRRVLDNVGDLVDGLLVEGWREGAVGGAGMRLALDAEAVAAEVPSTLSFVLAGGLTPDSVGEAVARFGPDVVDVSSGIEVTTGIKDHELIRDFIENARNASGRRPDRTS